MTPSPDTLAALAAELVEARDDPARLRDLASEVVHDESIDPGERSRSSEVAAAAAQQDVVLVRERPTVEPVAPVAPGELVVALRRLADVVVEARRRGRKNAGCARQLTAVSGGP